MKNNRYYIVNSADPNINDIVNVAVGGMDTQRKSLDGSKMVIKLHDGDNNEYSFLSGYDEYNQDQIHEKLNSEEWMLQP